MARQFKPLTADLLDALPSQCAGCAFWETRERLPKRCGSACDRETITGWMEYVHAQWGDCGRVAYESDRVLGFVKYAPAPFFPQTSHFGLARPDERAVLIACMHIEPEARHHGLGKVLLQAALRDLVQRGERSVEAFASTHQGDWDASPTVGLQFMLRNGFQVSSPDPEYPIVRLDLRSLAAWTENLEAVLESLRIPLPVPKRAPAPWANMRRKGHE